MSHEETSDGSRLPAPAAPGDWAQELRRAIAAGGGRALVADDAGRRFVVLSHERWTALENAERSRGRRAPVTLTAREREILAMVAEGTPGSVVAEHLGLATNTVAQHLGSVRRTFGVRSSAAAGALARRDGLI